MPIFQIIRKYLRSLFTKKRVIIVAFATILLILLCSFLVFVAEVDRNDNINSIGDVAWWAFVTVTTVGYGDIAPVTLVGRTIAVFMMIFGIGFIGFILGGLVSLIIELNERRIKGMGNYKYKDHFVICGWNKKTEELILEIKADPRYGDKDIIVVTDALDQLPKDFKHVDFIKGRPTDIDVLERANIRDCYSVIVLSCNPEDPKSDYETISIIMTIEKMADKIITCAELVNTQNRKLLEDAGCDAIIDISSFTSKVMIQSVLDPGVNEVVSELLSTRKGQQYYLIDLPESYLNKDYKALCHDLIDKGINVFALRRGDEFLVNPPVSTGLKKEDKVYVISRDVPKL